MDFRPKGERVQVKNLVGHAVALSTAAALVTAAPAAAENAEQNDSGNRQPSSTSSQQPAPSSESSEDTSEKTPETTEGTAEGTSTEDSTETSSVQESTTEENSVEESQDSTVEESATEESTGSTTSRSTASTGDPLRGPVYGEIPNTPGSADADEQRSTERGQASTAEAGAGEIQERYEGLDQQAKERVGQQEGDEVVVSDSLRYQDYSNARFYWSQQYGVKIVFGAVLDKYIQLGGHESLGVPSTDELTTGDGTAYNEFVYHDANAETTSAIYDHSEAGTHVIVGPMLEKWHSVGGPDALGYPISDTYLTYDQRATFNNFQNDATIFWTANTGAHVLRDEVRDKWGQTGGPNGPLGYPTIDQGTTPDGKGKYNHFENNASIYWTAETNAHVVRGLIRDKWSATGWERGPMGYPTTDEFVAGDKVGRYNMFTGADGSGAGIVWSPETGAHTVQGLIAQRYSNLGGPNGVLGYPTTDERSTPDGRGRYNHFNGAGGASIYWTPGTGAREIYGGIRDHWASLGWEKSYLGYPTTGEFDIEGGRRNHFEGGHITFYNDTGQIVDRRW
ncbi:uncharacterized protein with LGFP repeats [Actinopolyspora biskrensis]|uniref:Uncharacterized protein with LGFP repeats n=1 Tax=Actinopolyspora biskrensis TaxID=1470178 RepID=A0A852YZA3_9ACTN|nr:hypothetical protein [Actinopolyspora biskrensis]NYH80394.1 uncharacterized protein with LGFP repeats [Actinopolyspora biskrensis]